VLKKALGLIGRQDLVEEIEQKEQYFANLFRGKKGDSLEPKGLCLIVAVPSCWTYYAPFTFSKLV